MTNGEGTIHLLKDDIEVVSGAFVEKDKVYSFSMNLEEEITEFEVIYTPMGGLSADSIIKRITVTKRIFFNMVQDYLFHRMAPLRVKEH
ncbi:hypothetical protein GCM10020331_099700 [Ectobacillus funiculus]